MPIVILVNLLIAMMADTKISQNAEAEYQMHFARLVKEYYEATVFPVPLSIIEKCVNEIASRKASKDTADQLHDGLHWGRHYTWPASTLPFQLELAMRKVSVKQEMDKAALAEGAISKKHKELIAIAVALTTQCGYCLEVHRKAAVAAGANEQELAQATFVAVALRAGAALTHGTHLITDPA